MNPEEDAKGILSRIFSGWRKLRENPVSDIAMGFTPAGVVADVEDAGRAISNRDALGLMLAGAGFIPGTGDAIKGLGKALRRGMEGVDDLPLAGMAQKTQRANTTPTYEAALSRLEESGAIGPGLDYGAGLGVGARRIGLEETFEPFPRKGFDPTYRLPEEIPSDRFGRLTSLNTLNVMPREMRDEAVENIGRVIRPGGSGVITTRGPEVMQATGRLGPEDRSIITSIGTYQKGFTNPELEEYLRYILGSNFDVSRSKVGSAPASSIIRRLK